MNFQTLNKQRKFILISAVIGIISIFLPWFSAGAFGFSVHINGFHGWGILAFLSFIASIIIVLIGTRNEALDKNMWLAVIISGGVALLCVIITMLSSSGGFGFISAGFGFGIWIALAASIGVTLFAWMFRNPAHDFKSRFDSLKKTVAASAASFSNPNSVSSDSTAVSSQNKISELERLSKLKENGSITETEFQQLKSKLL
jgi:O-antigen/teichoic acid export membrane protein